MKLLLLLLLLFFFLLLVVSCSALDDDGVLLLSFKYSATNDPFGTLESWNYADESPCRWNGVVCATTNGTAQRVVGVVLTATRIAGVIPPDLAAIEHLQFLDLSDNSLNGTIPANLLSSPELRVLSLARNDLSGGLPERCNSTRLQRVDLSGNGLVGGIPTWLSLLPNLTALDLSNNSLVGPLPGGFPTLENFDLSSNRIYGSLPAGGVGGSALRLLNLSGNHLEGEIPTAFAGSIPANSTVDLSFNNLTGAIPGGSFQQQSPRAFYGNEGLCGKPLRKLCSIPSTVSDNPNTTTDSPPAFAALPSSDNNQHSSGFHTLQTSVVAAIVVGGLLAIAAAGVLLVLWVTRLARRKEAGKVVLGRRGGRFLPPPTWFCSKRRKDETGSDTEEVEEGSKRGNGLLVMVDGEAEMDIEKLLKSSAYIVGASGSSIVYKAVLGDGTALAVRRIAEGSGAAKVKDFEAQVKAVGKLRHPNLVAVRGFYWTNDEKLLICEYVPNGSLAALSHKKMGGSSPYRLPWDGRLRIARGVARGLAYLHDKKAVHGNLKPSNVLLGHDMEPKISDFGLDRVLCGCGGRGGSSSSRRRLPTASFPNLGSKRTMLYDGSFREASPAAASPYSAFPSTPYIAPEVYKSIKPSAKWDVYSFGVLLLELLTGRAPSEAELGEWSESLQAAEDAKRVVRIVDAAVRGEMEGREEMVVGCFRLGLNCAAEQPQRRPSMKEVVQVLEKMTTPHS